MQTLPKVVAFLYQDDRMQDERAHITKMIARNMISRLSFFFPALSHKMIRVALAHTHRKLQSRQAHECPNANRSNMRAERILYPQKKCTRRAMQTLASNISHIQKCIWVQGAHICAHNDIWSRASRYTNHDICTLVERSVWYWDIWYYVHLDGPSCFVLKW